ncbi:diacylglycerol/lipid kinase family protein [Lewinella sp. IMCC34191]|uniref:diacylglycerol/lipid kinase family protein n=1 Tax=Lewinella sp. IMCC34191 TaxID=2259172 RepID=UPI0018E4E20F|nr:diacylglycerol kinase family protein [Lewinella sp. IMCC34191]
MFIRPYFIVNPTAAGGRAARWWTAAEPVLRRHFPDLQSTVPDSRLEVGMLLQRCLDEGVKTIVGVGGDGTHHDLINGLVELDALDRCTYAPLPLGTGNDWCRTLAVPRHLVRWLSTMEEGLTVDHRIGRLRFDSGRIRYFINVAGMGYDAEVVRRAREQKWKHRLMYPLLTAVHLPGYQPPELILTYDDSRVTGRFHTINMGIGRYNGGGMQLVPQAHPTHDTLALTYARALPLHRIARHSWRFFTDTIGRVKGVTATHAESLNVEGVTGVEADGEYLGLGPVRADLLKASLRVHCGRIVENIYGVTT